MGLAEQTAVVLRIAAEAADFGAQLLDDPAALVGVASRNSSWKLAAFACLRRRRDSR